MGNVLEVWNWFSALFGKGKVSPSQPDDDSRDYVFLEGDETPPANGPWFKLVGTTMEDGKLKMEFDWSPDFLTLLADNGYVGADPDDVIMRWLNKVTGAEQ